MVAAKIEFKGQKAAQNLHAMIERAKNFTPALQAGAAAIDKSIKDTFRRSEGPDGTPWKDLAESTIESRRKGSDKPLIDSGVLQAAAYARVDGNAIVIGDGMSYAAAHQFGFVRKGQYKPKKKSASKSRAPKAPRASKVTKARLATRALRSTASALGAGSRFGGGRDRTGESYTITVPARPFLPVTADGKLVKTGPAGAALEKMGAYVQKYIATGKLK